MAGTEDHIGVEGGVHGHPWAEMHGGYFADPAVARPLVETVAAVLRKSPADMVVDLGGGTGFLLSQLAAQGIRTTLVNLDCSAAQLELADAAGIRTICAPIDEFKRADAAPDGGRICFLLRSLLHYFDKAGLPPALRHLRQQAAAGEHLIHQSAAFEHQAEADCLNVLYQQLGTRKWYFTRDALVERFADTGWRLTDTAPVPSLRLTSDELAKRYLQSASDIARIRDVMARQFGEVSDVFKLTPSGFEATLHYRIDACLAVP